LSKPQFAHLWSLVLGIVINLRAAKLVHLSAPAPCVGHRTRCGAFLSQSEWDRPGPAARGGNGPADIDEAASGVKTAQF
jgi:hypothetical protein